MKYLPESGENLFQKIKKIIREYEKINGEGSTINIAIGEPDTTPPITLRKIVAKNVLSGDIKNHTYWDNGAPEDFVEEVIKHHTGVSPKEYSHLEGLAIPGEKPMLGLLPIVCGANLEGNFENEGYMKNAPAYDVLGTWSEYLGEESYIWPIYSSDDFKLKVSNIKVVGKHPRMILTVKPGNPCPVGAKKEDWIEIIEYCIKYKIRLVNDAAYAGVVHKNHVTLTEVAKDYKDLDWMELFSLSKTMSACGWRLGCAYGSKYFIQELAKIKGNSDSGPFGPALVSIPEYLKHEKSKEELEGIQKLYEKRLDILLPLLREAGFKEACPTDAGFFTLWMLPKTLNQKQINTSEEFNKMMIEKIGLVGVPFVGSELEDGTKEQFIRYSVCAPFEDENFTARVQNALGKISISY